MDKLTYKVNIIQDKHLEIMKAQGDPSLILCLMHGVYKGVGVVKTYLSWSRWQFRINIKERSELTMQGYGGEGREMHRIFSVWFSGMNTEQKVTENDSFKKRKEVWSCWKLESRDESEAGTG